MMHGRLSITIEDFSGRRLGVVTAQLWCKSSTKPFNVGAGSDIQN